MDRTFVKQVKVKSTPTVAFNDDIFNKMAESKMQIQNCNKLSSIV